MSHVLSLWCLCCSFVATANATAADDHRGNDNVNDNSLIVLYIDLANEIAIIPERSRRDIPKSNKPIDDEMERKKRSFTLFG